MKRVIVIGCPGAGKSTFARKLAALTGMPLYYLDMIWHRADRTTITREEFDARLEEIMASSGWIIDGNYTRTLPERLCACDTVFFFDLPLDVCLDGAISRLGHERADMPWIDTELAPDFRDWILNFPTDQLPRIKSMLSICDKTIIRFASRAEADMYLLSLSKS